MENFISQNLLIIILVVIVVVFVFLKKQHDLKPENGAKVYQYRAKPIMTKREQEVFRRLETIFNQKFYIIPQVHLSSILSHEIKGQNWNGAFQHINRKSVDYVLLNKNTLELVCAVELDDNTHNQTKRQERDKEIERIFKEAKIPLVRMKNIDSYNDKEIITLFADQINHPKIN